METKDILLDEETRYLEFDTMKDYALALNELKKKNAVIVYKGIHRLEAGKWIIVIKEK